jgi:predicted ATPase
VSGNRSSDRFVIISGCSGGGKSTLLKELAGRGYGAVEEPGRRIVRAEADPASPRLPWNDPVVFAETAVELALTDYRGALTSHGIVFFDRGLIDALLGLSHYSGKPVATEVVEAHRFHRKVYLAPPWPEIHVRDAERRHGFDEAVAEYERLMAGYPRLGYEVEVLPKLPVGERADWLMGRLGLE